MRSPLAVYKLMILYMLKKSGEPISTARISRFLLDGYTNYLSLNTALSEMEESALIVSESRGTRTFLHITEQGEESLEFFAGDLSEEIRGECDKYLSEIAMQIRSDADTGVDMHRRDDGMYEVHMYVREHDEILVDLTLAVPDEAMARSMTENWQEKSGGLYALMMEKLL